MGQRAVVTPPAQVGALRVGHVGLTTYSRILQVVQVSRRSPIPPVERGREPAIGAALRERADSATPLPMTGLPPVPLRGRHAAES
jgi:hypothetical protein